MTWPNPRHWPFVLWVPPATKRASCSRGQHPARGGSVIVRGQIVEHRGCRFGDGEPEDRDEDYT